MKNIVVADKDKEGLNAISGFAVNAFLQGAVPGQFLGVASCDAWTPRGQPEPSGADLRGKT